MNKWTSRKIAFISILIAMSISFVVIGAQAVALSSIPSFKLSLAGLPVKIVGFLFGPIIGFITGFITDVLSFLFLPAFYNPLYSLALGVSGCLPGVSAIFFNYFYPRFSKENIIRQLRKKRIYFNYLKNINLEKNNENKVKHYENKQIIIDKKINIISKWQDEKRQLNFAMYIGIFFILLLMLLTVILIKLIDQNVFNQAFDDGFLKIFNNKIILISLDIVTLFITILVCVIARFKMKSKTYLIFAQILIFVVITEYVNLPIIAEADELTINIPFLVSFTASLVLSPIKIWVNLLIITFAIKIVNPLIKRKSQNSYIYQKN